MMRLILAVLALALAAGCTSQPTSAPQPKVNLSGYPPAFRDGYTDGCASVNAARKRDEARFKADASYAQGWRDGYDICQRQK